jgi:hypothetical protein
MAGEAWRVQRLAGIRISSVGGGTRQGKDKACKQRSACCFHRIVPSALA